jgi:hypothetical protein
MDPMKKNVSSTITCLLKAYYPGVYRPLDEHGRQVPEKDAIVIAHYHNYPVVTRRTILTGFLVSRHFYILLVGKDIYVLKNRLSNLLFFAETF